jgi:hypothetical protein
VSSVDALAASVAAGRECLRIVDGALAHARQTGDELAAGLQQVGAEARASHTRTITIEVENQQAMIADLAELVEQLQLAVEALRSTGSSGGAPTSTPTPGTLPGPVSPWSHRTRIDRADVTRPRFAPDPNRLPGGTPTELQGTSANQQDLRRENDAAKALAAAGYDIEQNPPTTASGKNPDFLIQGEIWDCYSPRGSSTRTIHTAIREKVGRAGEDQQADRIVLNLDGCGASPAEIRSRLERSPISRLREIKIVKDGTVAQFYPWESEGDAHGD